ncbi:MAG: dephospho-CoA kinase [Microcoleaceae cyanobacterium MO_207.B10]|nr:dephospho-CoA kinase [Microcoleaceae cyanobacterium MO_207.B10]
MRLIGLTGGIATGKTTVSEYLSNNYQIPIWDADIYSREAVNPGSGILENIIKRYGTNILLPEGTLNRRKLGEIVFNNQTELSWLEQQIHPYVRDRFCQNIQQFSVENTTSDHKNHNNITSPRANSQLPTAVLVVPLLFEAKMTDLVTEIWVIYASPQQQVERLIKRDQLTQKQAYSRINHQIPIQDKCQQADVILDNSSTQEALLRQIDSALLQEYFQ